MGTTTPEDRSGDCKTATWLDSVRPASVKEDDHHVVIHPGVMMYLQTTTCFTQGKWPVAGPSPGRGEQSRWWSQLRVGLIDNAPYQSVAVTTRPCMNGSYGPGEGVARKRRCVALLSGNRHLMLVEIYTALWPRYVGTVLIRCLFPLEPTVLSSKCSLSRVMI